MGYDKIEIQGHRGCRGLYPENSIPGFIHAVNLGVNTLELDVVISGDEKVVVSHEPYFSGIICALPQIDDSGNLYKMTYEEIKNVDCGTIPHAGFPVQKKVKTIKPLMKEVIETIEKYVEENGLNPVKYNIEIKSTPEEEGVYQPRHDRFSDLVMAELTALLPPEKYVVQSFDYRVLRYIKKRYPQTIIALLTEVEGTVKEHIEELGFVPDIYSCEFALLSEPDVRYLNANNIRVIPWTVNEAEDMIKMLDFGVDGIITDYPDRLIELMKERFPKK